MKSENWRIEIMLKWKERIVILVRLEVIEFEKKKRNELIQIRINHCMTASVV
jgi:hypothetical protein